MAFTNAQLRNAAKWWAERCRLQEKDKTPFAKALYEVLQDCCTRGFNPGLSADEGPWGICRQVGETKSLLFGNDQGHWQPLAAAAEAAGLENVLFSPALMRISEDGVVRIGKYPCETSPDAIVIYRNGRPVHQRKRVVRPAPAPAM